MHKPDVEYFAWGEKKHKYIYALEDADPFYVFNDVGFVMDDEFFDKAFLDCPSMMTSDKEEEFKKYKEVSDLDKFVHGKGKSKEEIIKKIRSLKREINQIKFRLEAPVVLAIL